MRAILTSLLPGIALLVISGPILAQTPEAKGIEFFERKIRPVLAQHCYRCHSEDAQKKRKLKADLFVDSRAGLLKGGDSGPALVPGKAKASLLLKALKHDGLEMPPGGKLPPEVIADFARWIDMGAPDPRTGKAVAKREIDIEAGRQFWSFQPLHKVMPPTVKNGAWARNAVDRFILQKQEEKGITPAKMASREKLIRRAYYDLIGLPPTPEEIDGFLKDSAPDAWEELIARLLASPQYGERWARHWLDVVRFAESGGYEFDGDRPGAHHYRDFVIKALNQDMPFDQFVRLQLAGDRLQPNDYLATSATGFLVAGPYPGQTTSKTIERIRYDQLDDMLATTGSAFLGLTMACTRCHEHKYDPIPQQEYYRLLAALSRTTFANLKLDTEAETTRKLKAEFDRVHAPLLQARQQFEAKELPGRFEQWRAKELAKLPAAKWLILEPVSASGKMKLTTQTDGSIVASGKAEKNDTYTISAHTQQKGIKAIRIEALTDKTLPGNGPGLEKDGSFVLTQVQVTAAPLDAKNKAKPAAVKLKAGTASYTKPGQALANVLDKDKKTGWGNGGQIGKDQAVLLEVEGSVGFDGGTVLTIVLKFEGAAGIGKTRLALATAPAALTDTAALQSRHEIATLLGREKGQLNDRNRSEVLRWYRRFDSRTDEVLKAVEAHQLQAPQPKIATVFAAGPGGGDVFFLGRGEVDRKQGKASPGYIQVLTTAPEKEEHWLGKPEKGKPGVEPRIALGNWMTDAEHGAGQLLARVIVNRLWKHHFGRGIVATPNDFGAQGERPSHPELLDWLASELIRNGWKLKAIHKLMMTSAVYRQGETSSPNHQQIDPENRWLWQRQPRRLEAEAIRDGLLHVSGSLNPTLYGPGTLDDNTLRRSIYLTVKRSRLSPFLQMFDCPEPIQSIGERSSTTVPTQALYLMNSPFVRQRAEKLAQRIRPGAGETLEAAVNRGYLIALSRQPTAEERLRMVGFIEQQRQLLGKAATARDQALTEFCQVLLCLNEFVYVD